MSFEFSPETFLAEINFQIEILQSEIRPLEEKKAELLSEGRPEILKPRFGACPPGVSRLACNPGVLNTNELQKNQGNIAFFDRKLAGFQDGINKFEAEVSELLNQKRLVETEIEVRSTQQPTDINLDAPAPILLPQLANQFPAEIEPQKLPLKELAIIGAILLLI